MLLNKCMHEVECKGNKDKNCRTLTFLWTMLWVAHLVAEFYYYDLSSFRARVHPA